MTTKTIEDLLPSADWSVYRLVRMASKRALELADGSPCLIDNPSTDKVTSTALEEIAQGKVEYKDGADETIAVEVEENTSEEE